MITTTDQAAVVLYVILDRDLGDFCDDVAVADLATLQRLHQILTYPNDKHTARTKSLNALGASIVERVIQAREPNNQGVEE